MLGSNRAFEHRIIAELEVETIGELVALRESEVLGHGAQRAWRDRAGPLRSRSPAGAVAALTGAMTRMGSAGRGPLAGELASGDEEPWPSPVATRIIGAILILLVARCGDDDGPTDGDSVTDAGPTADGDAPTDAGSDCSEPALGCPCTNVGESICTTGEPGPDLLCTSDGWVWSYDGPCPGLDAGPPRDFGS